MKLRTVFFAHLKTRAFSLCDGWKLLKSNLAQFQNRLQEDQPEIVSVFYGCAHCEIHSAAALQINESLYKGKANEVQISCT